jgi:hypothetical protein
VKLSRIAIRRLIAMTVGFGLLAGVVAQAVIPLPARTMKAIAGVNRASGRTQALQLELRLRIGNEPPIAVGELISHPSGLARLEVRGYEGRVDRYLLSGDELVGTVNGERISRPGPLLQPFFLLQPGSESTMRTALEAFGIRTESIGLAPCGEEDCFVIGDPRLEAPLPMAQAMPGDGEFEDLGLDSDPSGSRMRPPREEVEDIEAEIVDGRLPRFWVDTRELQVQRIDRADGVIVIFGPVASFEQIKVPAWFEIHEPEEAFPMRFEVDRAVQVNAPPNAFDRSWLIPTDAKDADDPA